MSQQLQAFLDDWLPVQVSTGRDVHSGDATSWIEHWSHTDPVSVFGAGVRGRAGWDEVLRTIHWVAGRFAGCEDYEYELVSADVQGDLAYTCGFERYTATRPNGEVFTNELRVTQVYRREAGGWRIVHRHGDAPPSDPVD
jgi:ketosteroid isomerase-like protein